MYKVSKRMEIAGSHRLDLPYESKCKNLHGHNWIITVHCRTEELTAWGMVVDFTAIKNLIHDRLDHADLTKLFSFNTTAENMAKWVLDELNDYITQQGSYDRTCECYKVEIQESEGNVATYEI